MKSIPRGRTITLCYWSGYGRWWRKEGSGGLPIQEAFDEGSEAFIYAVTDMAYLKTRELVI